jgi:hypothetical protein
MKQLLSLALVGMLVLGVAPLALADDAGTVVGDIPSALFPSATGGSLLLKTEAGTVVATLPISGAPFTFSNVAAGRYVVEVRDPAGALLATSLPVTMEAPVAVTAIFGTNRPLGAAATTSSKSKVYWILGGAAAAGIVTAVVIASSNDEGVASPIR